MLLGVSVKPEDRQAKLLSVFEFKRMTIVEHRRLSIPQHQTASDGSGAEFSHPPSLCRRKGGNQDSESTKCPQRSRHPRRGSDPVAAAPAEETALQGRQRKLLHLVSFAPRCIYFF